MKTLAECRVTIIGLGLMGGSLAWALRGKCLSLRACDTHSDTVYSALTQGLIERAVTLEEALDSDLLILAAPVQVILSQLAAFKNYHADHSVIVLDLGSTKTAIVSALNALPAWADPIGGHPMCGKETGGLAQADPTLYHNATFVLSPLERTTPHALQLVHELIATLGARPFNLNPHEHDRLVAVISHLPYVTAIALMQTALNTHDERLWSLIAGGFRDTTRIAAKEPQVMADIVLTNRVALVEALRRYQSELAALIETIEQGDAKALQRVLTHSQRERVGLYPSPPASVP